MDLVYSNFIRTTLTTDITAGQTNFAVADTSKFPVLGTNEFFYLTLTDIAVPTTKEIIRVTAWSGSSITAADRGVDGTSAIAWTSGDLVEGTVSRIFLNDYVLRTPFVRDTTVVDHADGTVVGSIKHCIDAIGATESVLELAPGTYTLANNLTIPANVTLAPQPGAVLDVVSTKTLTVTKIKAGPQQIFSGAGSVAGTIVGPHAFCEWFGGGVGLDSGAAINKALAISDKVVFGDGEYTIEATIVLDTGQVLEGISSIATVLKLKNSADVVMIKSKDFDTLTGSNKWFVTDGVPHNIQIRHMQIDGNHANQSATVNGVSLFCKRYNLYDVIFRECADNGLYTEAGHITGQNDYEDMPESFVDLCWFTRNQGNGWQHRGSHDTQAGTIIFPANGGWGLLVEKLTNTYDGSGLNIDKIHTYANNTGGIRVVGGQVQIGLCIVETESPGLNIEDADNTNIERLFCFANTNRVTLLPGPLVLMDDSDVCSFGQIHGSSVNAATSSVDAFSVNNCKRLTIGEMIMRGNGGGARCFVLDAVGINDRSNACVIAGGNIEGFSGAGGTALVLGNHTNAMGVNQCQINLGITNCEACLDYENANAGSNMLNLVCSTNAGQTILHASSEIPAALATERHNIVGVGVDNKRSEEAGFAAVLIGTTSIVVSHNLVYTPVAGEIQVTPTNSMGSATKFWVDTLTATTFTINVDADPTSVNANFAWKADVRGLNV